MGYERSQRWASGFLVRSCYLQRLIGKKCRGGGENQELSFIDMVGLRCILDMPLELAIADKRPRLEIVQWSYPHFQVIKVKPLLGFQLVVMMTVLLTVPQHTLYLTVPVQGS